MRRFSVYHTTTHKRNPFVFMDVSINSESHGRIVYELFYTKLPKTTRNFLELCRGYKDKSGRTLSYKGAPFHRIVPGLMVRQSFLAFLTFLLTKFWQILT